MKKSVFAVLLAANVQAVAGFATEVSSYEVNEGEQKLSVSVKKYEIHEFIICTATWEAGGEETSQSIRTAESCKNSYGASDREILVSRSITGTSSMKPHIKSVSLQEISGPQEACLQEQLQILRSVKETSGKELALAKGIDIRFTDNSNGSAGHVRIDHHFMSPTGIYYFNDILSIRTAFDGACDLSSKSEIVRVLERYSKTYGFSKAQKAKDTRANELAEKAAQTLRNQ